MASILPPIPRAIFTVFEPISLQASPLTSVAQQVLTFVRSIAGAVAPVVAPEFFVATQLSHLKSHALLPTEQVLALQLGNLYLLLCLLGVFILNTTSEARVLHAYILA